jgi:uncharacterized ferritin-like protein (DUF455 family)
MQIRLYVDEDAMARTLVRGLRARGVDVATVLDAGMSERDDMAQLEYATQHGCVLYTYNIGHFCHLNAQYMAAGKNHAGIIVVFRQRYSVGEQIRRLSQVISIKSAEEMRNNLLFL